MMLQLISLLGPIFGEILKDFVKDKGEQAELEQKIQMALLQHTDSLEKIRGKIVMEEARSEHWLVATWRPLLMLIVVAIIAMNYLVFPIITMLFGVSNELVLPTELWTLLQLGVGGYIVGRSGEKMVDKWKVPEV